MSDARYRQLLAELCDLVRIDDAQAVLDSGSILINEVAFSLLHVNEEDPDSSSLGAYCDFGEVPDEDQPAVLRRLLEVNLFLSGAPMPCSFSINPETSHVLLCICIDMLRVDAQTLVETLRLCTEEAQRWRDTYFLEEESAPEALRTHLPQAGSVRL